jgi:hypothetical protein
LVSHLAILCRDPNRFEPTGCAPRVKRKGGLQGGWSAVCCCVVVRCVVVVLLYGALLLLCCCAVLHCCVTVVGTVFELQHEWSHHWVDTLSCNPTVTTPSCYCGLLHCCAALLCCTVVLYCCAVLLCYCCGHRLRVTTPSCHPVVRPHSQHRKVTTEGIPLRNRRDLSHRSKTGH